MADEGISWEDYQRALADAHKTKWDVIKEVAWGVLKEISGWNDIVACFTKGDIWACGGLVAGLVPWGKVGKILEAGYNAVKAVNRLAGIVDKAKGVLRRVQTIADDIGRAATEQFQKLTSKGSTSCALHSFVATTLVLGRFVNIGELKPGQRLQPSAPSCAAPQKPLRRTDPLRRPARTPGLTRGLDRRLPHLPTTRPGHNRPTGTPGQQHLTKPY